MKCCLYVTVDKSRDPWAAVMAAADAVIDGVFATSYAKAIKQGGPSHAGMSGEAVSNARAYAEQQAADDREHFQSDLETLATEWRSEVLRLTEAGTHHGDQGRLARGLLNIRHQPQFERRARSLIRKHYARQWQLGRQAAGNMLPMTADDSRQLLRMQRNEQQYLINLLRDIRTGHYGVDPFQRLPMYVDASREAYYAGMVMADLSRDVYWQWIVNPSAEHCGDCVKMASGGRWARTSYAGTYAASELAKIGVFPNSGRLECCTHCRCGLKSVPRPSVRPRRSKDISSMQLRGVTGNVFGSNGRNTEGDRFSRMNGHGRRERLQTLAAKYSWDYKSRGTHQKAGRK